MTKKEKLIWRLSNRPSVQEVRELVKDKIITQDEAREILFSLETQDDRDKDSLEAEIKFLRQLVENLSKTRTQIVETIRDVYIPYKKYEWYKPYEVWCMNSATTTANYKVSNQAQLSTLTTGAAGTSLMAQANNAAFSNIKTF